VDELGNPKADESGKGPGWLKRGKRQCKTQKEENDKERNAQIKEAGERTEKRVVGEPAVTEKAGIGPPKEAEGAPAPGGQAMDEVQIRRKEKASQKVSKPKGQKLRPKTQDITSTQNRGEKSELAGEMGFSPGHKGILAGHGSTATLRLCPLPRRITLAPKSPKC